MCVLWTIRSSFFLLFLFLREQSLLLQLRIWKSFTEFALEWRGRAEIYKRWLRGWEVVVVVTFSWTLWRVETSSRLILNTNALNKTRHTPRHNTHSINWQENPAVIRRTPERWHDIPAPPRLLSASPLPLQFPPPRQPYPPLLQLQHNLLRTKLPKTFTLLPHVPRRYRSR